MSNNIDPDQLLLCDGADLDQCLQMCFPPGRMGKMPTVLLVA